jgi:class 3 adenylate cyclase
VTPETLVKYMRAAAAWDASAAVPNVQVPTLLVQHPDARYTTLEAARRLMAALPDARLHMVEQPVSEKGNPELFAVVAAFVGGDQSAPLVGPARGPAGTAVILFTDIADSTALTERMGDAAFRAASRGLDEGIRGAIRSAGGSPVEGKVLGDGVMGVFSSAAQAIVAARALREDDNVYGGAVNIASRICGLCAPGEILVSQTVRDLARTSAGVTFEDRGEHALKGIEDSVRVFAVRAED